MAKAFRIGNRAKWVGIRPGHDGSQVANNNSATNTLTIIHTVTAGKTLFLTFAYLSREGSGTGVARLGVRDASDVVQYYIYVLNAIANSVPVISNTFELDPWEIPAGYDVFVDASAANTIARASIKGWEA